jgi:hypothetical protein
LRPLCVLIRTPIFDVPGRSFMLTRLQRLDAGVAFEEVEQRS